MRFGATPEPKAMKAGYGTIQSKIDSLKNEKPKNRKIYPFNPNYITDFKGYKLGMSVDEIDRLLEFRKANKYVNSANEFQMVTKVSDSLLKVISPYFKFPDWVRKKPTNNYVRRQTFHSKQIAIIDINFATAEDLIKVYGVGPALSERILKQKELLGGFTTMDQIKDIWGLSDEVVSKLKESFDVKSQPSVKKVRINEASLKELSQFPYFRYPISRSIVTHRSMHGAITKAADLAKIPNFPVEQIDRIAIYLEF